MSKNTNMNKVKLMYTSTQKRFESLLFLFGDIVQTTAFDGRFNIFDTVAGTVSKVFKYFKHKLLSLVAINIHAVP